MSQPALSDSFISNKMEDIKPIIESLLFVAEAPLTIERIKKVLTQADTKAIREALFLPIPGRIVNWSIKSSKIPAMVF